MSHGKWLDAEKALAGLILAVACAFLLGLQATGPGFDNDAHGFLSSDAMSWARNMAIGDGHGVIYEVAFLDADGHVTYQIYNRFPHTVYWWLSTICRAATGELATQVMLARQAMNLALCVALFACWGTLLVLGLAPAGAAAAVLLTFSSHYVLTYNDMVFHNTPTLAGVALVFLSIACLERGLARRWHVILAGVVAVSLGWQAYAVLGAWWLVQVVEVCVRRRARTVAAAIECATDLPATMCLSVAIIWGMVILSYLMLSEWRLLGGRLLDCPSVRSMIYRLTGAGGSSASLEAVNRHFVAWPGFVARQAHRVLGMMTPLAGVRIGPAGSVLVGLVLLALGSLWLRARLYALHRTVWVTMALSGVTWALVMRHYVAFHALETIFYLGIPLAYWALMAKLLPPRPARSRWIAAILCLFLFVGNVAWVNQTKSENNRRAEQIAEQFEIMQPLLPRHSAVYIDPSTQDLDLPPNAILYYVAGRYVAEIGSADYAISVNGFPDSDRLTDNAHVNLYRLR